MFYKTNEEEMVRKRMQSLRELKEIAWVKWDLPRNNKQIQRLDIKYY